jgi:hypothetical protein
MQDDIDEVFGDHATSVDFDLVSLWIRLGSKLCDDVTVDADPPPTNELLRVPA